MKKIFFLAVIFALCGAGTAFSACTAEELQAKALEYAGALQQKAEKDPAGYAGFVEAHQAKAMELQKTPDDMDAYCKFYDEAMEELKK